MNKLMSPKMRKLARCPNCEEKITGTFCANCGQKQQELNIPLQHLLSDFLDSVFTLDSRILRTFTLLISKPGELTERFKAGQRIRFMPPLKLYLFISLVFFFVLTLTDVRIFKVSNLSQKNAVSTSGEMNVIGLSVDTTETPTDSISAESDSSENSMKEQFFNNLSKATKNPAVINTAIVHRMPQMMFLMVPFFALLLKLLYLRQNRFYVNHLVFGFHFHSFAFIVFLVTLLFFWLTGQQAVTILWIALPIYLFVAMRRVYHQSKKRTLLKLVALTVSYWVVLSIAVIIVAFAVILFF